MCSTEHLRTDPVVLPNQGPTTPSVVLRSSVLTSLGSLSDLQKFSLYPNLLNYILHLTKIFFEGDLTAH